MTRSGDVRRSRGLSMIEVLVALGILSVAVLGVLGMFPSMARLGANTSDSADKLYAAQDKLDELLDNDVAIGTSYTTDYPFGTNNGYRRWRGITDTYNNAGIQTIEVEVTWFAQGRSRSIFLYGQVSP